MKSLLLITTLLFTGNLLAQTSIEVVKLKIDWTNAKECGIEGCKPQHLILKSGDSMMFGYPSAMNVGFFAANPSIEGDKIKLTFKKLKEVSEEKYNTTAKKIITLEPGKPEPISLAEFKFLITATTETMEVNK